MLTKGTLLIANPDIIKNFYPRSVILLCEHAQAGSFGITLNHPMPYNLPPELQQLENFKRDNLNFRIGGEIDQFQMMLIHNNPHCSDEIIEVTDNIFLGGNIEFLQECLEDLSTDLLLCFGYNSWPSGELEREVDKKVWFTHPSKYKDIFGSNSNTLWKDILLDKGGSYANYAQMPDHLEEN